MIAITYHNVQDVSATPNDTPNYDALYPVMGKFTRDESKHDPSNSGGFSATSESITSTQTLDCNSRRHRAFYTTEKAVRRQLCSDGLFAICSWHDLHTTAAVVDKPPKRLHRLEIAHFQLAALKLTAIFPLSCQRPETPQPPHSCGGE